VTDIFLAWDPFPRLLFLLYEVEEVAYLELCVVEHEADLLELSVRAQLLEDVVHDEANQLLERTVLAQVDLHDHLDDLPQLSLSRLCLAVLGSLVLNGRIVLIELLVGLDYLHLNLLDLQVSEQLQDQTLHDLQLVSDQYLFFYDIEELLGVDGVIIGFLLLNDVVPQLPGSVQVLPHSVAQLSLLFLIQLLCLLNYLLSLVDCLLVGLLLVIVNYAHRECFKGISQCCGLLDEVR
jgi:hypothetical protein